MASSAAYRSWDGLFRRYEELRLEWNDTGHAANGGRTPNEMMLAHVMAEKVCFAPAGEIERNLARTVPAVITTDGVVFDGIRYKWNRTGVTKLLSENLAAQHFATRLEGTARCGVTIKVFDWDLDRIEVLNDRNNDFVPLWSDDPTTRSSSPATSTPSTSHASGPVRPVRRPPMTGQTAVPKAF